MKNVIRTISIISYLLIILAGQMIGLPFYPMVNLYRF